MKVKEESEKAGLKLNIQETKVMASGPITSWQIDEEKKETVTDFIFLGSKITVDGDCSHEIKRHLLLGRKAWKWQPIPVFILGKFYEQRSLAGYSQWDHKELDMTYRLNNRQHIKNRRHHFANKGPYSQSYGFSSSHVWMW